MSRHTLLQLATISSASLYTFLCRQHPLTPVPIAMSVVTWSRGIGVKMLLKYTLNNVKFIFLHRVTDREFLRAVEV